MESQSRALSAESCLDPSSATNSEKIDPEQTEPEMILENGTSKVQDSLEQDADQESASGSSVSVPSHTSEDPLTMIKSVIKWKNNVGYLPGSVCRFKLDSAGELLLVAGDEGLEEEPFRKRQKLMTAELSDQESEDDEIARCKNCKTYGLKRDFFKDSKFCKDCMHLNPTYYKMFKQLSLLYEENKNDTPKSSTPATSSPSSPGHGALNHFDFKTFSWKTYMEKNKFIAIPYKSFLPSQLCPTKEDRFQFQFQVGMKLEGIDPFHPSRFCVLTVTEIIGPRLRLHFDGYKRKYDFWVNSSNEFIFPAGFCRSTHRKLEPPRGIAADDFVWERYLAETNAEAAPWTLFTCPTDDRAKFAAVVATGFNVGMKLEAVDRANNNLVCVASIKDILNDHLLIHFDGWDDSYDYWAHHTSPLIHPINWCKSRGKPLTAPNNYQGGEAFNWDTYLAETDMVSVPARAFKTKINNSWKTGMKLEALDLHNPRFIRVATIASRTGHFVKIHFDGWDDKYDYWIDDDCPNLHPINWCSQANHPLQPPPSFVQNSKKTKTTCTVTNCNGRGHVRWYNHRRHDTVEDCPYSDKNLDTEPTDRYESDNESVESDEDEGGEDEDDDDDVENDKEAENLEVKSEEEKDGISEENQQDQMEMPITNGVLSFSTEEDEQDLLNYSIALLEQDYCTVKQKKPILSRCNYLLNGSEGEFELKKVTTWDYTLVERFVRALTGDEQSAALFSDEKIDGEAMLLLKQSDITDQLHLKLGPATKLYSCIAEIRAALLAKDYGHQQVQE